jgi:competence protein ComEC
MTQPSFRFKKLVLFGALAFCVSKRLYNRFWDPNLTLTFFDVGQGDAALIQFPFGRTMLIDGGGGWTKSNLGTRVLFPELTRLGILTLDTLLMSHPDNDHARGFLGIIDSLRAKELWLHQAWNVFPKRPLLEEIETKFSATPGKIIWLNRILSKNVSGVKLQVIPLKGDLRTKNDQALVVVLNFARCTILFTGDIERESEKEFIEQGITKVHLLKIPHHGSYTSSTWRLLKNISPDWAVVSVGRSNTYGHPRKEILSRYRALGIPVFRTDFHGAVRFTITPEGEVNCENYLGDCGVSRCD